MVSDVTLIIFIAGVLHDVVSRLEYERYSLAVNK